MAFLNVTGERLRPQEEYRNNGIGRAIDLLIFIRNRQGDFRISDLARDLESCNRTAQRWLVTLEARGLVEIDKTKRGPIPWMCRTTPYGREF